MHFEHEETTSPRTCDRYERLKNEMKEGKKKHEFDNTDVAHIAVETSPLLRVLRNSKHDGSYLSLPSASDTSNLNATREQSTAFRPTVFAERALGALLHGILFYVWAAVIGLGVIAL